MPTRFAPIHPISRQLLITRYVIGALFATIAILLFVVVSLTLEPDADSGKQPIGYVEADYEPAVRTARVVVADKRIEEGIELQANMFRTQPVAVEYLRPGAVLAKNQLQLVGKYATHLIHAGTAISLQDVSEKRPFTGIHIPDGYRAVSIIVNTRSAVDGFVKPNSRVDILHSFTDDYSKERKVQTLVYAAKVLALNGSTANTAPKFQPNQKATATVLVTEYDAKRIELAQHAGSLSLSLLGNDDRFQIPDGEQTIVSIDDIARRERPAKRYRIEGTLELSNPKTGKTERYVVEKGRKRLATEEDFKRLAEASAMD